MNYHVLWWVEEFEQILCRGNLKVLPTNCRLVAHSHCVDHDIFLAIRDPSFPATQLLPSLSYQPSIGYFPHGASEVKLTFTINADRCLEVPLVERHSGEFLRDSDCYSSILVPRGSINCRKTQRVVELLPALKTILDLKLSALLKIQPGRLPALFTPLVNESISDSTWLDEQPTLGHHLPRYTVRSSYPPLCSVFE